MRDVVDWYYKTLQRNARTKDQEEMSNRKPSQFLRHLRKLAGNSVSKDVSKTIRLSAPPTIFSTFIPPNYTPKVLIFSMFIHTFFCNKVIFLLLCSILQHCKHNIFILYLISSRTVCSFSLFLSVIFHIVFDYCC